MVATKGYGLSVNEIDWSSPADMKPYLKAHKEELKEKDYLAWLSNQYTLSAVLVAVEHCLAGKKAKSEYVKELLLSRIFENEELTEEQIQKKEINKAILAEKRSITISRIKGLPETIIK